MILHALSYGVFLIWLSLYCILQDLVNSHKYIDLNMHNTEFRYRTSIVPEWVSDCCGSVFSLVHVPIVAR